ncbi:MAG TPA: DUF983 domain-containing protein [Aestuariivirgaceae bacterium]|jgi:uncharacterized protein (DUF983 family)
MESRSVWQAVRHGTLGKCPRCGKGRLFRKFLKTIDRCAICHEELFHHRADDAPPYFTILIVGHLVIPWVLVIEVMFRPPLWIQLAVWIPVVLLLSLLLLPVVKGAIVGMQWATRMHGFANANTGSPTVDDDRDITYLSNTDR